MNKFIAFHEIDLKLPAGEKISTDGKNKVNNPIFAVGSHISDIFWRHNFRNDEYMCQEPPGGGYDTGNTIAGDMRPLFNRFPKMASQKFILLRKMMLFDHHPMTLFIKLYNNKEVCTLSGNKNSICCLPLIGPDMRRIK